MTPRTDSLAGQRLGDFLEALASEQPVPGGGAAAAVSAALAASLTAMVVRLSLDREKYAGFGELHAEALAASDAARLRFTELAEQDAAAYAAYRAARGMPHETDEQRVAREAATREAARAATKVPLELVKACQAQVELVERCAGRTNLYVASDLEVAALLLDSAARAAAVNVRANLPSIGDEGYASAVTAELDQRLQQVQGTADRARERVAKRTLRKPEGE
ncbi:MAG: cyclodeaminase/cyclohydrolase family protein [Candidatus Limnocylindrales bacterium]